MKITNEVIEQYIDYLSCNHDDIMKEITSNSARISRELANEVYSFLEKLKRNSYNYLVLPVEDNISRIIVQTIRNGYFNSIKNIENFIKKQNKVFDYFVEKDEKELDVDSSYLLSQFKENSQNLNEEDVCTDYQQISDQIIIQINSQNNHNKDYMNLENMIKMKINDIISYKFKFENSEFIKSCALRRKRILSKTLDFSKYILEQQKKQLIYWESLEKRVPCTK